MPRTSILVEVLAKDRASGILGKIGRNLGDIGKIAAGVGLARLAEEGIRAGAGLVKSTLAQAGAYQLEQASLKNLLAVSEMFDSAQWEQVKVGTKVARLTDKQREALQKHRTNVKKYSANLELLNAKIQEQAQRVWEMKNKWTEQGLAYKTAVARLNQMNVQRDILSEKLEDEKAAVKKLQAQEGKQVPIYRRNLKFTLSYSKAVEENSEEFKELWKNIKKMAITRGVDYRTISQMYQYGLATGVPLETLKELVPLTVDWAVATGKSQVEVKHIGKALGDVASRGHLAAQEIYQFANVNIPLQKLLAQKLGITTDELMDLVRKGAIPASLVFETLNSFFQPFTEAAEDVSETLPRATEGFKELVKINLAEALSPASDALAGFVKWLTDIAQKTGAFDKIKGAVKSVADWFADLLDKMKPVIAAFLSGFEEGGLFVGVLSAIQTIISPGAFEQLTELLGNLGQTFHDIGEFIRDNFMPAIQGVTDNLPSLEQILGFINDHWGDFDAGIKAVVAAIAAAGIAALIGGIVSAITSLATSIGGIILIVGILAGLWTEFGDDIMNWASNVWYGTLLPAFEDAKKAISTFATNAVNWVTGAFTSIGNFISGAVNTITEPLLGLYSFLSETFGPYLSAWVGMWESIGGFLVSVGGLALTLAENMGGLLAILAEKGWEAYKTYLNTVKDVIEKYVVPAFQKFYSWVRDAIDLIGKATGIGGVGGLTKDFEGLRDVLNYLIQNVFDPVSKFFDGLASKVDAAKDALKKFGVSKEIEPGSPSPLELSIRGINAAFEDLATTLRSPGFMSPVSSPVPIASGPTYNVVVNVSGGSPEGVHEAAYSAVIQAFQELEAQLRV